MKKILLHTIFPGCLNGPNTVNRLIRESNLLQDSFVIEDLNQTTLPGKNPFKFIKLIYDLKKDIVGRGADAIIVTGLQFAGFCCTLAAKLAHIKRIVVCVHGYAGDDNNLSPIMRWLFNNIVEPWTIRLCDSVYTVCEYGANRHMMKKYARGKLYGTIHNCFPNPVEKAQEGIRKKLGIDKEKVVIASVGRVTEDKGHREIINALKMGLSDEAVFIVVGDGNYLNHYTEECQNLIEEGRLILLGQRDDVLDILLETDIFVFPTYHENLSMALLEACYSRCAVVATDVDGNPEVIKNGISGLLIEKKNAKALHDAMNELIHNEKERTILSNNAFYYQQNEFSYQVFQERIKTMLEKQFEEE